MARALAKKGHCVDLLISSRETSFFVKKENKTLNLSVFKLPRFGFLDNGRILRGIMACFFVIFRKYNIVHIFESVQFETNIPLVLCKVLRKKVVLDIGDDWLDSPTYHGSNWAIRRYIRFCDLKLPAKFNFLTVTSEFLKNKYNSLGKKNILKIVNGVDLSQFKSMSKEKAREALGIPSKDKIILSFGNTYEGGRAYLLLKTFEHIYNLDNSIKLYFNMDPNNYLNDSRIKEGINRNVFENIKVTGYITKEKLAEYLGASDVILFLTGSRDAEKACFPIRIGTYLNGERVIAIDKTDNEAYNTLARYNCVLSGEGPQAIAKKVIDFFNDELLRHKLEENVVIAKKELSWDNLILELLEFYKQVK